MLLKNLVKKLIDKMSFADNKVYIELYSHDKEKDELKFINLILWMLMKAVKLDLKNTQR